MSSPSNRHSVHLTSPAQHSQEIGNTYVGPNHRWVVSLVVGYRDHFDPDFGVASKEEALAAALDLTRDGGHHGTQWFVHDRATGETQMLEQGDFEPLCPTSC